MSIIRATSRSVECLFYYLKKKSNKHMKALSKNTMNIPSF